MDKLTSNQKEVISELLFYSNSSEFTQEVLRIIGKDNWSREIMSDSVKNHLTHEQNIFFESLGGGYSTDEISKYLVERKIERRIAKELKSRGATAFLYENQDYLSALRNGQEIFEGIDVEQIKNDLLME